MNEFAIFVSFKAKPGMRDKIRQVYEELVKPHASKGEELKVCCYSYSLEDKDTICLFELHLRGDLLDDARKQPWFQQYMSELDDLLAEPPRFIPMSPKWIKGCD